MKKCFKCGEHKEISCFYKHKDMKDGHLNKCKDCTKNDSFNNHKNYSQAQDSYDKTEKGVIRVMYKTQKRNSKIRGHTPPEYTKEELKIWLYSNGFKKLYDLWVKSGFNKNKKPSVDRMNDFLGYSFNNIRLGTWQDNMNHQIQDTLNGTGTSGRKCKPVLQFDSNMNLLAKYVSFSSACRCIGYSIEHHIKTGRPDRRNGFIWQYA